MITCEQCGFRNMNGEVRCLKCQGLLVDDDRELKAAALKAPRYSAWDAFRDRCLGWWVWGKRRVGWDLMMELPTEYVPYRIPRSAAAFSAVFPGLGQLYNRQTSKAVVCALFWVGLVVVNILLIRHPLSNILLVGALAGWCMIWADAYVTAARMNGQHLLFRQVLAVYFGIMAIMFAMITFLQFNFGGLFAPLKTVLSSVHRPVIQHGDIVWTNLAPYLIHPPRRGDMLYFDPPRFTIEQPGTLAGNLISVNITDYFQRVLAVEGDRVSRRNGVTIVNSRPLRPEEDAVGGQVLGDIEEFVVPQGRVFAPITRVPGDLFQSLAEAKGLSEVSDTSLPRLIYTKLREAGLPGREDWLGRAEVIVHPPQHRTFLRVTANP